MQSSIIVEASLTSNHVWRRSCLIWLTPAARRASCKPYSLQFGNLKNEQRNQADVQSFRTNLKRRFVISRPRRSKASILNILDLFRRSGVCCAGTVWRHHWRLAEFCVYVLGINGLTFCRNPVWMARLVWMGKTTKEHDTNSSHPCQNTQIYGCVGEYGCMVYLYNQDILWVSCFSHVWTNLNFNMPLYLMAGHNMSHHSASALLCTSMITTQELKTKQPNKHPSTILYSGWWVCSHFRTSPNVDCYRHPKTFMQGEVNTAFTNMIVPGRRLFPLFPGDHTAVKARLIIFANLGSNGTFCKHCDSNNGPRSSRTFVLKNGFMNQSLSLHGLLAGVRGNSLRMLKEILSNNTTKCFRNK